MKAYNAANDTEAGKQHTQGAGHPDHLTVDDLRFKIRHAEKVEVRCGSPNPLTREGIYIAIQRGLSAATYFYGLDKTTGKMIVEWVG